MGAARVGGMLGVDVFAHPLKKVVILLPAFFPDAIGPGEYHGGHIGCPACSTVQRVADFALIWVCVNPACDAKPVWLERSGPAN